MMTPIMYQRENHQQDGCGVQRPSPQVGEMEAIRMSALELSHELLPPGDGWLTRDRLTHDLEMAGQAPLISPPLIPARPGHQMGLQFRSRELPAASTFHQFDRRFTTSQ